MQIPAPEGNLSPIKLRISSGWIVIMATAILPFLLLAYYNYPSIHDDYTNANNVIRLGRIQYIREGYISWTGRYTELVLKAYLNPLVYQQTTWLSRIQPVVVIGLLVLGAYTFFRYLLLGVRNSVVVACSLLLTIVYINGFTIAGSALYWFGGYTSYTSGVIASLFAFAGMVCLHRYQGRTVTQIICLLGTAFFSILAIGAYDVSMMAICWILVSTVGLVWTMKSSSKWWFIALFFIAMIGTYVAVVAPGNQARAMGTGRNIGHILRSPQAFIIVLKSTCFALTQSIAWTNSLLLILGCLLLAGLLAQCQAMLPFNLSRLHPALLALWLLGGIAAMIFPSILVYQAVWPHSWQCVYFYFVFGLVWLFTTVFVRYTPRSILLKTLSGPTSWYLLAVAFCLLCLLSSASNTHLAFLDLATKAARHYARVRQREQHMLLEAAAHAKVTEIRALYDNGELYKVPNVMYTYDFNENDASQFARYYGVDSVVIKPIPYHPYP